MIANGPGCVKTHTAPGCTKYDTKKTLALRAIEMIRFSEESGQNAVLLLKIAPEFAHGLGPSRRFVVAPNGGLIVTGSALANVHHDLIVILAARHKLPAVYSNRVYFAAGGLASNGPDFVDQYRRAAGYVDRILKGEKPADLRCRRR
jgi:hypothetical protein